MPIHSLHALKVATLRRAAEEYLAKASEGEDAEMNVLLARYLSGRADRIEAGESDFSEVFPDASGPAADGAVA